LIAPTGVRTRIKICCIADAGEARLALHHGAAALGLVSAMPSGPGVISLATAAQVVTAVGPEVDTFLLSAATGAEALIAQQRRTGATTLQVVDRVGPGVFAEVRAALPEVRLVGVVHVLGEAAVSEARALAPLVDAVLLDSGDPTQPVKTLGGTGRTHDWALSRAIVDALSVPVWLAGGLRPDNAAAAIDAVRPHGLDLCSGVRTGGALDPVKLARFMAAVCG
jgi:phosphoribosylanthranilate isomerase